jgi:hypothetical protein
MVLVGKSISPPGYKIMVMYNWRMEWLVMGFILIIASLTPHTGVEIVNNNSNIFTQITFSEDMKVMGINDYGYVVREGPYGNQSANITVAYILGVHPLEFKSHWAIKKALMERKDTLKYKYYVYEVSVLQDRYDYNLGRMHGQELAQNYVVPDITNGRYQLAIDVHSNRGNYSEKRFISVPIIDKGSEEAAQQIVDKIFWLKFYIPPIEKGPTSGPHVSIPLIKSGTPTIVYETYGYDSYEQVVRQAFNMVDGVDESDWS